MAPVEVNLISEIKVWGKHIKKYARHNQKRPQGRGPRAEEVVFIACRSISVITLRQYLRPGLCTDGIWPGAQYRQYR